MAMRRLIPRSSRVSGLATAIRGGHGHTIVPPLPPLGRQPPHEKELPELVNCVDDNKVAPEFFVDIDAPNVSGGEAVVTLACAFGFLYGLYLLIKLYNPEKKRPVAPREAVLSAKNIRIDLGLEEPGTQYEYKF